MKERVKQFSPEIKGHLGYKNLTHQVSKPGTRWTSVSKGSSRKSRRASRKSKTRRSKHRK